ncbi:uncharacterized [Tachysurus ichikawai]
MHMSQLHSISEHPDDCVVSRVARVLSVTAESAQTEYLSISAFLSSAVSLHRQQRERVEERRVRAFLVFKADLDLL